MQMNALAAQNRNWWKLTWQLNFIDLMTKIIASKVRKVLWCLTPLFCAARKFSFVSSFFLHEICMPFFSNPYRDVVTGPSCLRWIAKLPLKHPWRRITDTSRSPNLRNSWQIFRFLIRAVARNWYTVCQLCRTGIQNSGFSSLIRHFPYLTFSTQCWRPRGNSTGCCPVACGVFSQKSALQLCRQSLASNGKRSNDCWDQCPIACGDHFITTLIVRQKDVNWLSTSGNVLGRPLVVP